MAAPQADKGRVDQPLVLQIARACAAVRPRQLASGDTSMAQDLLDVVTYQTWLYRVLQNVYERTLERDD